jgi:hypothetical protein
MLVTPVKIFKYGWILASLRMIASFLVLTFRDIVQKQLVVLVAGDGAPVEQQKQQRTCEYRPNDPQSGNNMHKNLPESINQSHIPSGSGIGGLGGYEGL